MDRVRQYLTRAEPTVWHFWGDSITHGAKHTYGQRDYCQHFEERVRYEMGRSDDAVLRMAVSGYDTTHLLARFEAHVARFRPDVMFLMIGMNDCSAGRRISREQFVANLKTLAKQTAELPCLLVLQTTCPVLPGMVPDREPRFDTYMQAIREVSGELGLPLVDHTAHWMKQPVGRRCSWMDDPFHPGGLGHLAFARLLLQELGIADAGKPVGQLYLS